MVLKWSFTKLMILSTNLSNSDGQRPEALVNAKPHLEIFKHFKSEPMPKNHRNPENTFKLNKMHRFSVAPMLDRSGPNAHITCRSAQFLEKEVGNTQGRS